MKSLRAFSAISIVSIALANVAYETSQERPVDLRLILGLSLIFAIASWFRAYFYRPETTFFDVDHDGKSFENEKLIVFGSEIADLAHESKERQILMDLVDPGSEGWKLYVVWVVCCGLSFLLLRHVQSLTVVSLGWSLIVVSSICFSPFLSQMLVPLISSLILAIYAFTSSDALAVTLYFIACVATFFVSVVLYREIPPDRLNSDRRTEFKLILKNSVVICALFFAVFLFLDFLLPQENPFSRSPKISAVVPALNRSTKFSTQQISRKIAEQMVKIEEKRSSSEGPEESEGPKAGASSSALGSRKTSREIAPENSGTGGNGEHRTGGDSGGSVDSCCSVGSVDSVGNSNAAETVSSGGSSGTTSSAKSADSGTAIGNGQSDDPWIDHGDKLRGSSATGGSKSALAPSPSAAAKSGTSSASDAKNIGAVSKAAAADAPSAGLTNARKTSKSFEAREKKIEQMSRKFEVPIEITKGILFLIAAVVTLSIVFKIASQLNDRPEDELKNQQLSERQRKKLQSILHQIRARGLLAEAEVIETYNALLAVFEMGHHARDEWLPAEDFSMRIAESIPPLATPFVDVTKRFSKTLYGRKPVLSSELEVFRLDVEKILRFFQVSVK